MERRHLLKNEVNIKSSSGAINITDSVVGNGNVQVSYSSDLVASYSRQLIGSLDKLSSFFAAQPKLHKEPVEDLLETIENTQQRLQGLAQSSQTSQEEQLRVQERLNTLKRRIHTLELQSAQLGIYTPPYIVEDLRRAKELAEQLQALLPKS